MDNCIEISLDEFKTKTADKELFQCKTVNDIDFVVTEFKSAHATAPEFKTVQQLRYDETEFEEWVTRYFELK
jgi:hypothetical protein